MGGVAGLSKLSYCCYDEGDKPAAVPMQPRRFGREGALLKRKPGTASQWGRAGRKAGGGGASIFLRRLNAPR